MVYVTQADYKVGPKEGAKGQNPVQTDENSVLRHFM